MSGDALPGALTLRQRVWVAADPARVAGWLRRLADRIDPTEPASSVLLHWARAHGASWARMAVAQRSWSDRRRWSILVDTQDESADLLVLWPDVEADALDGLLRRLPAARGGVAVRTTRTS